MLRPCSVVNKRGNPLFFTKTVASIHRASPSDHAQTTMHHELFASVPHPIIQIYFLAPITRGSSQCLHTHATTEAVITVRDYLTLILLHDQLTIAEYGASPAESWVAQLFSARFLPLLKRIKQ